MFMLYLCLGRNICLWYIYVQDGLYADGIFMFRTDCMYVHVIFMFRTEYMFIVYLCSGRMIC